MRADGYPQEAWERLGRLLEERRGELNPGWANRAQFLRDTGMNKKLIERLELAKLDSYRPATLAKVSVAYGWTADSIRRILSGGEPVVRADAPAPEPQDAPPDDWEIAVMARADIPYPVRLAAIRDHRGLVEGERRRLRELGIDPDDIPVPSLARRAVRAYLSGPGDADAAGQHSRGA